MESDDTVPSNNKAKKSDAARSKAYRDRERLKRDQERQLVARVLAMTPQQVQQLMGYKPVNMLVFCQLAQAQCTWEEIAGAMDMSLVTMKERRKENPLLDAVYLKAQAYGKSSLRRKQYDMAQLGDSKLLIFLGKQYLGQVDKVEQTNPNLHEAFVLAMQQKMPGAFADAGQAEQLDESEHADLEPVAR